MDEHINFYIEKYISLQCKEIIVTALTEEIQQQKRKVAIELLQKRKLESREK